MSKIDILIKNASIVGPATREIKTGDIAIADGKIVDYVAGDDYEIADIIDATGYYVSPGWIDSHTHVYEHTTEAGFAADLHLIPMGVTATIDGGSTGIYTYPAFKRDIVDRSIMDIFYSVNVSPAGQITEKYPENVDPALFPAEVEELREIFASDPHARGLKLRYGAEVVEGIDGNVLDKTIELATELGQPITLHVTNPAEPMEAIASRMRPGDVICHCYQGKRSTMIGADGHVKPEILAARERGVRFDSADARINHCYRVIYPAIADGFFPDIISTDITKNGLFNNMLWGLPVVLSKWLNLGLPLADVIACCTKNPADIHGLPYGLGTLAVGAKANITIFSVEDRPFHLQNRMNETFDGTKMILPQATIVGGRVRYKSLYFPF